MSSITIPNALTLVATNVPDGPYPLYAPATSYDQGERIYIDTVTPHQVYQSLQDSNNGHEPLVDANWTDWWSLVGVTNKYAMLDDYTTSQTSNLNTIEVTLSTSKSSKLGLFNLVGETVRVVTRSGVTEISDDTYSLRRDTSGSWVEYWFDPVEYRETLIVDIPGFYQSLEVDITITAASGTNAQCGHVVLGVPRSLGELEWGVGLGALDYSYRDKNQWGETKLEQLDYSPTRDIDLWVDTDTAGQVVDRLNRLLIGARSTPALYDLNNNGGTQESLQIFGYYESFKIVMKFENVSMCAMSIEGLT